MGSFVLWAWLNLTGGDPYSHTPPVVISSSAGVRNDRTKTAGQRQDVAKSADVASLETP